MTRAERNIAWCEHMILIPEGKFVGQPLVMADFMKEDFRAIFDNPAGTRRAIISRARKNAKTVETAMLMLLYLCGPEAAPASQLYSAARSRDQASILFNLAARMCRMNPGLMEYVAIKDSAKEIHCPALSSRYKALSAEATTAYGFSPRFVAHDELGQVRGPHDALYEALETATAAQEAPISIIISTQAPTDNDLLSVLIDDGLTGEDPRVVVRLESAPTSMDTFSEEAIRAANPALDLFMNKDEVFAMADAARRMPSRQPEFENLVLNRRVEATSPFVTTEVWRACGGALEPFFDEVFGGLDLSMRTDLTALVLVGRAANDQFMVLPYFWTPEVGLRERSKKDRVPYDLWVKQGFLLTTPGATVDYEYVAQDIKRIVGELGLEGVSIRAIGFDRWRVDVLQKEFERTEVELPLIPHGQGFMDMSPALDALEAELLNGRLVHGGHPVLTMCAMNAVVVRDAAGNRKLAKDRATGRIDGMVALAMAFGAINKSDAEAEDLGTFFKDAVIG